MHLRSRLLSFIILATSSHLAASAPIYGYGGGSGQSQSSSDVSNGWGIKVIGNYYIPFSPQVDDGSVITGDNSGSDNPYNGGNDSYDDSIGSVVDGDHPGQPTYDASSSDAPPYVSDDQQSAGSAPYDSPHQPYMYNNEDPSSVDDLSMATSHVDDSQAAATPVYGGDGQTETTISAEDSHHTAPYDNNSEAEAITFAYDNISQHTPPYEEDHQAAAMTGYGEDIQAVATTTDFYHDTVEAVSCAYGEGCSLATTSYEDNREAAATSVYINEGYHPDGGEPQAQATTTYAYESEDQTVATALADNTQAATITHEYIGEHQAVATSTYVGESQATSVTNDYDSASEADATTVITYEHSSSVTAANECAATAPPTMEQMQSAMGSWDQTQYAQMHSYIQSAMAAHNGGFGY